MAPLRRVSGGSTPGHQRSIASFFSGTPPPSAFPEFCDEISKKPVLLIQPPGSPEAFRRNSNGSDVSLSPSKRSRMKGVDKASNKNARLDMSHCPGNRMAFSNKENSTTTESVQSLDAQIVKENKELLVGRRLKVYWPLDDAWYGGRVKSYCKLSGLHGILYEDGEEEQLRLEAERVVWLEDSHNSTPSKHGRIGNHNKKRKATMGGGDAQDIPQSCTPEADVSHKVVSISDKVDASGKHDSVVAVPNSTFKRLKRRCQKSVNYTEQCMDHSVEDNSTGDENREEKVMDSISESDSEPEEFMDVEEEVEMKSPKKSARRRRLVQKTGREVDAENRSSPDQAGDEKHVKGRAAPMREKVQKLECQRNKLINVFDNREQRGAANGEAKSAEPNASSFTVQIPRSELQVLLTGEAAERFGGRVAEKFKFLEKNRRDAAGRRPNDPLFDARTLFLPPEFCKSLSGGQRQWWEFKSKHMDKVLFFKMGKFYELFEMDAHIGAQELDLQYMKGNQPHCGFPEKNYSDNVEKLARKGYRVLVVEQIETPEQLEQRRKETGAKDKVVNREICAVITKGTMLDGDMVAANSDAAFLLAITETFDKVTSTSEGALVLGICAADAATSLFMLGQFVDDPGRTRLRALLAELRPVELIKPRGMLTEATERALRDHTRLPLINDLEPNVEFWDSERSLKEAVRLYSHFQQERLSPNLSKGTQVAIENPGCNYKSSSLTLHAETLHFLPDLLFQVVQAGKRGEAALSAFGGCLSYLRMVMLDESLLRCGRLELLPGSDSLSPTIASTEIDLAMPEMCRRNTESNKSTQAIASSCPNRDDPEPYMLLDSAALENLEILENNRDGGTSGTLLGLMDHCVTASGRRLLKQWLVRPLLNVQSILQRQFALSDLQGPAENVVSKFRKELQGLPDMERLLARLNTSWYGRNSQAVVLYEDAAQKQLKEFLAAVRGCRAMINAVSLFESCTDTLVSTRLKSLVTIGKGFPNLAPFIKKFEASFDWLEAEKNGRIIPCSGVDEAFDSATLAITSIKLELDNYIEKQRQIFGNSSEITYVTVGKDSYQLEIPDHFHAKLPLEYEARSSKKGYHRYITPKLKELLQELAVLEDQRETALKGIFHGLLKQFCEAHNLWFDAVKAVAEIDALVSLLAASLHMEGQVCLPSFLDHNKSPALSSTVKETPFFMAKALQHPSIGSTLVRGGLFVPNDVILGGEANAPLMLLTGPNMGGKSTLLRQVCLAVILAQVGAYVPAEEFRLSPVDRVFVRMGARDHIMAGKSTFLLELSEAASMLNFASRNSLVALDELGRGTATSDGQAIAYAVLEYFAQNIGCLGMFSSHYHRLADEHAQDPAVASYHMACKVGTGAGGLEEVTFLYKLTPGACPKSYGVNVARLAGMPETVLERATRRSSELELREKSNCVAVTRRSPYVSKNLEIDLVKEVLGFLKHQLSNPTDVAGLILLWEKVRQFIIE
ncbi:hypothetical protein O6H91_14G080400 [Diphasiastrum complanatum]|uniref:Uncharacterized protein n=1 Tax=Diphasiastrum complanatum TaxID=34168 RepID=A0ACC2BS70_DIPCM|nr:hypothetical protein O6H91_14G080400 [Diphasiastrum complanatum]